MTSSILTVKNISKVYKLYSHPIDRFKEAFHPFGKKYHRDFFALKDISFSIGKGETLGVLGHNGSGKSTLLKLIANVLTPSVGSINVIGKSSALLELGAGFNPELTGLENVYFNSAVLGYSQSEIEDKLDAILAFADIGDFIHQPIKTYSSGMMVRLAFAIAIHIDPEVLIIDEALSVGDMRFQLKCFKKLTELKEAGKTFLLVSHDTGIIRNMCDRVIWLHHGEIFQIGDPKTVTRHYEAYMNHGILPDKITKTEDLSVITKEPKINLWSKIAPNSFQSGTGGAEINRVAFYLKSDSTPITTLEGEEDVEFCYEFIAKQDIEFPLVSFLISDEFGKAISGSNSFVLQSN